MATICVLCGTDGKSTPMLHGVNGFVCLPCLGDAFAAVARAHRQPKYADEATTTLNANRRCLVCAEPISRYSLVAYRGPYCFCNECLGKAVETCLDGEASRLQIVEF